MPTLDPAVKAKLNAEFARRLEAKDPPELDVIVETEPGRAQELAGEVAAVEGVSADRAGIVAGKFIPATVPQARLGDITAIPGVVRVHQDQLVGIKQAPDIVRPVRDFPFLTAQRDPVRQALSDAIERFAATQDPFLGRVGISKVEVPRINFAQLPPGDPVQTLFSGLDFATGSNLTGQTFIPTSQSVEWLLDEDLGGVNGSGVKAAVIDTGYSPLPLVTGFRTPRLESFVPGELPVDAMGHGTWCTNTVVGGSAPSSWGTVRGVATQAQFGHFKALNTFPGFGMTSWIMNAMERANEWGADVVSMSLGGAQQGPVDQDPFVTLVDDLSKETKGVDEGSIWVVAAGNSGPDRFTIGSPGVAPKALTVASWSLTDGAPAVFSSRGPQGDWYADNPSAFERDLNRHGPTFLKPDLGAPGGGRETQAKADENEELLHQAEVGWVEGLYDGLKGDGRGLMKGTCLTGDTRVLNRHGTPIPIERIDPGTDVLTYDDGEMAAREVNTLLEQGVKPVYDVAIGGREITATGNHPFLCVDHSGNVEWKPLIEMDTDDRVVVNKRLPDNGEPMSLEMATDGGAVVMEEPWPKETMEDFMRCIGFFLGDGWLNEQTRTTAITLAAGEHPEVNEKYVSLFNDVFNFDMSERTQDGRVMHYYAASTRVAELFTRLDLDRGVSDKYVPEWVFGLPRSQQEAFIEGLIDADGWVTEREQADQYGIELTSERLIRDAHRLVQNLGWKTSTIETRDRTVQPPNSPEPVDMRTWKFTFHKTEYEYGATHAGRADMDFRRFQVRPVRSIEKAGYEEVYDIEVEGSHNFLANGIVVHNSMACPHAAGLVLLAFEAGLVETAADVKALVRQNATVPEFATAAPTAREVTGGKNIAVGHGPLRASTLAGGRAEPATQPVESAFD